jgi:hypothetical protein
MKPTDSELELIYDIADLMGFSRDYTLELDPSDPEWYAIWDAGCYTIPNYIEILGIEGARTFKGYLQLIKKK